MNRESLDKRLSEVDREVIGIFQTYIPEYQNIATDTYSLGLILREMILKDMERRGEIEKSSKKGFILENETLSRFIIMAAIFGCRYGIPQIKRLLKAITRK